MNDYKIPIIEPKIDYTKVPPINQKRTISFINHFIIHTVTFLNKFALSCEEKLFEFENKLQRVEASLEILESRLSSIPGLEQDLNNHETIPNEAIENNTEQQEIQKLDEPDDVNLSKSNDEKINPEVVERDPCYDKYFKMVHFGVLKEAVKLKMEQEGLDSSVLDDPRQIVFKPKSTSNGKHEGD